MNGAHRFALLLGSILLAASIAVPPANAAAGDQLWVGRYDNSSYYYDAGRAVTVSPNGSRVFVAGVTNDPGDFVTIAYDASDGSQLWASTYDGPNHSNDEPKDIAVSPDGSKVFVIGSSWHPAGGTGGGFTQAQPSIVAYDAATGGQLWDRVYTAGTGFNNYGNAVAVSPDGLTAFTAAQMGDGGGDALLLAYNTGTGGLRWAKSYLDGTLFSDVAVTPDGGRVIAVGQADVGDNKGTDMVTVSYNPTNGNRQWAVRADSPEAGADSVDMATSVAISPNSKTVYVAGVQDDSAQFGASAQFATIAYRAGDGGRKWLMRHPSAVSWEGGPFIAVAPDGQRVFMAGSTDPGDPVIETSDDYLTVAYSSAGTQLWEATFDSGSQGLTSFRVDQVRGLGVAPDGSRVYVTGVGCDLLDEDTCVYGDETEFRTIAYKTDTGEQRWTKVFTQLSDNEAQDLAVAPVGSRVFVTGGGHGDVVTVAYAG